MCGETRPNSIRWDWNRGNFRTTIRPWRKDACFMDKCVHFSWQVLCCQDWIFYSFCCNSLDPLAQNATESLLVQSCSSESSSISLGVGVGNHAIRSYPDNLANFANFNMSEKNCAADDFSIFRKQKAPGTNYIVNEKWKSYLWWWAYSFSSPRENCTHNK